MATAAVELASGYVSVGGDTRELSRSIRAAFRESERPAAESGQRSGSRFGSMFGNGLKVAGIGAAGAVGGLMGAALTKGFGRLTAIDEARAKLRGLGHDAKTIEQAMTDANASVKGTAFGLDEAATTAAMAMAAGVKTGKDLEGYLKTVADTATIAGTSMSEMGSIFGKVATSNKIQGDVINQLGDKGIPIIQMLAKEMKVPADAVADLASDGKVNFETFRNAMQNSLGGAALKSGETFTGALKNTGAALGRFGAKLLEPVFQRAPAVFGYLTEGMDKVTKKVGPFATEFGTKVSEVFSGLNLNFDFSGLGNGLRNLWATIQPTLADIGGRFMGLGQNIMRLANEVLPPLTSAFNFLAPIITSVAQVVGLGLLWGFKALISTFSTIIGVLATVTGFFNEHKTVLAGIGIVIGTALLPYFVVLAVGYANVAAAAVVSGIKQAGAWLMASGGAVKAGAVSVIQSWRIVGAWIAMGAGAMKNAAVIAAGWVVAGAGATAAAIKTAAFATVMGVVKVATMAWTGVQWLLNAALNANPIGLIVIAIAALVAGIVLAWKNSETFRNIVMAAWNGIKTVIGAVWGWLSTNVFPLFKIALQALGMTVTWLWKNIMSPAWNGIKAVIGFVWGGIQFYFNAFKAAIKVIGDAVSWFWRTIIEPAWNAIGNIISTVWNSFIKPAWDNFKRGIEVIGNVFKGVVDGIGRAWEGMKALVAKPINFVIETVWNNGLRLAWNKIADFLPGLKPMEALRPVAFQEGGPVPFTKGAKRGKDSVLGLLAPREHVFDLQDVDAAGGQDQLYKMRSMLKSGKPFTWMPGKGVSVGAGEGGPLVKMFAKGGAVDEGAPLPPSPGEGGLKPIGVLMKRLIHRIWPSIKEIGGYRQDAYPEHPSGRALDVMVGVGNPIGDQVNDWAHGNHGQFPLIHSIWKQAMHYPPNHRVEGMEDRGSPTQNHMDHPHIWWQDQPVNPNLIPGGLKGGMSAEDQRGFLSKKVEEIMRSFFNPAEKLMNSVIKPPPEWQAIPGKALATTRDTAIKTVVSIVEGLGDKLNAAYDKAKDVLKGVKNVASAPIRAIGGLLRDEGGVLPTGLALVRNETGKPEAVLNWQQLDQVRKSMEEGKSFADSVKALGLPVPSEDEAKGVKVALSAASTLDQVKKVLAENKPSEQKPTVTAPSMNKTFTDPNVPTEEKPQSPTEQFSAAKTGKEFFGTAGKIMGESLWDILIPSSSIPDPFALKDRYTIKPSEQEGADSSTSSTSDYSSSGSGSGTSDYSTNNQITPDKVENLPDIAGTGERSRDGYVNDIAAAAKKRNLPLDAGIIAVGTALVESELKMYANSSVPESLKLPHDAVGSDHDSVGLFQQRQSWGPTADLMNAFKSAGLFYDKLTTFAWQSMAKGDAAQKVQVSAFPDKYEGRMDEARKLLVGKFDSGGLVAPGISLVENRTRRYEPLAAFNRDQWETLRENAESRGGDTYDYRTVVEKLIVQDMREAQRGLQHIELRKSMRHSRSHTK